MALLRRGALLRGITLPCEDTERSSLQAGRELSSGTESTDTLILDFQPEINVCGLRLPVSVVCCYGSLSRRRHCVSQKERVNLPPILSDAWADHKQESLADVVPMSKDFQACLVVLESPFFLHAPASFILKAALPRRNGHALQGCSYLPASHLACWL